MASDLDAAGLAEVAQQDAWPSNHLILQRLDVRDPADWAAAVGAVVARWGRLDAALLIAGALRPGWIAQCDADAVHLHVDVNVKGVMFGVQAVAAQLRGQALVDGFRGHLVVMASMAALAPIPGLAHYSASKFAVRAFCMAAAEELRPESIAVSVLCPDAVATPMLDLQKHSEAAALTFSGSRVLSVDEVVAALERILVERPLLVALPAGRGWLARLGDLFPGLGRWIAPSLRKKGERARRLAQ